MDLGLQKKPDAASGDGLDDSDASQESTPPDGTILSSLDIESMQPRAAKDFTLFLNLVDFLTYFLALSPHSLFRPWGYVYFKHVITGSNRHPSVSGFYKLLTVGLYVGESVGMFGALGGPVTAPLGDGSAITGLQTANTDDYCTKLVSKFAIEVCIVGLVDLSVSPDI